MKYKSKSRSDNDPHIFAVVDRAHQQMMHHHEHQTIVLTGESGGGKSYNAYQCVVQMCHIGRVRAFFNQNTLFISYFGIKIVFNVISNYNTS